MEFYSGISRTKWRWNLNHYYCLFLYDLIMSIILTLLLLCNESDIRTIDLSNWIFLHIHFLEKEWIVKCSWLCEMHIFEQNLPWLCSNKAFNFGTENKISKKTRCRNVTVIGRTMIIAVHCLFLTFSLSRCLNDL